MNFLRSHRILHDAEFKSLFDKADKVSHRCFTILYKKNDFSHPRLGLIVGKRVAKKAVSRNQIKRVVRESFRLQQEALPEVDIVVIARTQCDKLSKQKLREGIEKLWAKLLAAY